MVLPRMIHVARNGDRFGKFALVQIPELVSSGLLRPDDDFWESGMSEWRPLNELPELRNLGDDPEAWKRQAKGAVADAANLLARGTAKLAQSARHFASTGTEMAPDAIERLLRDFQPRLRERAQALLSQKPFLSAPAALENHDMMERAFESLYDSLPQSISQSVPQYAFVEFCLHKKLELLQPDPGAEAAAAHPVGPEVYRLSHVRLLVTDYATMLTFYRDKLGLGLRFNEEGVYAEFDTGPSTLALFHRDFMAEALHSTAPHEQALPLQRPVVILSVEDVDACYIRLGERGVEFLEGPMDRPHWGVRTIHFTDPEGNLIEINSSRR